MHIRRGVGIFAVGLPLVASGQTATDLQTMQQRQQQLETQVKEQNARIQELERLVRDLASGKPAQAAAKAPSNERPTELSEPATYPAVLAASPKPGPEYIGNLGFKIYES